MPGKSDCKPSLLLLQLDVANVVVADLVFDKLQKEELADIHNKAYVWGVVAQVDEVAVGRHVDHRAAVTQSHRKALTIRDASNCNGAHLPVRVQ
jgi:hypothetical protein